MTRRGPTSFALLTALAALGCAVSEPIDLPTSHGSAAGGSGTGGGTATGGTIGTGGVTATGGTIGTGGVTATGGAIGTGGVTATGGTIGTGGAKATGGTIGTGGAKATGGKAGTGGVKGTGGTTGADGGAVTFTEVYTQVIANNCFGSGCHNPASSGRPSFATQSICYTYFKNQGQLYRARRPRSPTSTSSCREIRRPRRRHLPTCLPRRNPTSRPRISPSWPPGSPTARSTTDAAPRAVNRPAASGCARLRVSRGSARRRWRPCSRCRRR